MTRLKNITALRASLVLAVATASAHPTAAQTDVRFSMDWRGPTNGHLGMGDGDILQPASGGAAIPASKPSLWVSGLSLGLIPVAGCNPAPGVSCGVSLDAFSYGSTLFPPSHEDAGIFVLFSVDRLAQGAGASSDLTVEAATFDQGSDVFAAKWLGANPTGPLASNRLWLDGDGLAVSLPPRPGVGLDEPNDPSVGWPYAAHDNGDDLDAFDVPANPQLTDSIFFSVPSGFVDPADPATAPAIPSTAVGLGVSGADVLLGSPGLVPTVYASAAQLGLDRFGKNSDDIDALHVCENGGAGFRAPTTDFGWGPELGDLVAFSLRRGSATIGRPDSRLGLDITEGDLLTAPTAPGLTPQILVRAEDMGLRSNRSGSWSDNDDLDGAAISIDPFEFTDCNMNNIDDADDIRDTVSDDVNNNGVPDECEYVGDSFCTCSSSLPLGCRVANPDAGCGNTVGDGAKLQSYGRLDGELGLNFLATGLPVDTICKLRISDAPSAPAVTGSGVRCTGPASPVLLIQQSTQGEGESVGICGFPTQTLDEWPDGMTVTWGQTLYFQAIYRDLGGHCGAKYNFTNGVSTVVQ